MDLITNHQITEEEKLNVKNELELSHAKKRDLVDINNIKLERKNIIDLDEDSSIFINEPQKLKLIFAKREESFLKEYNINLQGLKYSEIVYYYTRFGFRLGRLIISGNQISVLPCNSNRTYSSTENPLQIKTNVNIIFPLLTLNFDLLSARLFYQKATQHFQIMVLGYKKMFMFYTKISKENFNKLMHELTLSICTSEGFISNKIGVSLREDFDKSYFLAETEFRKKVKTGDILIFKGFGCSSECQRLLTGAEYDHVALLLKRGTSDVRVYESTSKEGCRERTWFEFICFLWNLLYEKMTYRQLIINHPNEEEIRQKIQTKMEEFVENTEGKKYKINFCGICCPKGEIDYEVDNKWDKSKGFFCSQLVYASYLNAGIIKYTKDTSTYLPGIFSRTSKLPFEKGFDFGPEYILEFSK